MKTPAPLLFLEMEGVLVLGASKKGELVADAVSDIARGNSTWRDHQEIWANLFATEPVRQLKALHDQFRLRYCLTTEWATSLDKSAMLTVLRMSGLGFVASNLHARWHVDRSLGGVRRADQIEAWLRHYSDQNDQWVVLDSEVRGPDVLNWPEHLAARTVFCCFDVGLTEFEAGNIRERFLQL
ncbi:MAG: HAD domain-containing protein [Burkholderiales bacterium]